MAVLTIPATLDEILIAAEKLHATSVSLEYDSSGDLEVTYLAGSTGLGVAV